MALVCAPCLAGVQQDLQLLRDRCLYFAAGRAPNDPNTVTLYRGLYRQSPWPTPSNQIDIAASGFSLAALPAAVECGVIGSNAARAIATNAAGRVREMVARSAGATNQTLRGAYGYEGMLYHYYVWSDTAGEFQREAAATDVEVSSVDTALLLWGLHVSAHYFGEPALTNYVQARGRIAWSNWLDRSSAAHTNQFYLQYMTNSGLTGHWDWRSDETALVCVMAALGDPNLDARMLWGAWMRTNVTYVSPGPTSQSFSCHASWNGDPFTDFQALAFLDTSRFPPDFDGVDWFGNNAVSYRGHVEFFAKERGYLDGMTYSFFFDGSNDAMSEPKSNPGAPLVRRECPLHSLAGGLPFYSPVPASNVMARTLSLLVTNAAMPLFGWHGWPAATVIATNAAHATNDTRIVGQNVSLMALSIDNYLTNRAQNIALRDAGLRHVLNLIHPPEASHVAVAGGQIETRWRAVPFSELRLQSAAGLQAGWTNEAMLQVEASGIGVANLPAAMAPRSFRVAE